MINIYILANNNNNNNNNTNTNKYDTLTKIQIKLLHIHPFIISLVKTKRTELNKILT